MNKVLNKSVRLTQNDYEIINTIINNSKFVSKSYSNIIQIAFEKTYQDLKNIFDFDSVVNYFNKLSFSNKKNKGCSRIVSYRISKEIFDYVRDNLQFLFNKKNNSSQIARLCLINLYLKVNNKTIKNNINFIKIDAVEIIQKITNMFLSEKESDKEKIIKIIEICND